MSENVMRWRWARREVNCGRGLKRQLPTWQFLVCFKYSIKKKQTYFSNLRLVHFKRYIGARIQEAITINYFPEGNILDSGID